ncbi:MAG: DUF1349 domain-containing protein [Propioniciclava sp.]
MRDIAWSEGHWTHSPAAVGEGDEGLRVTAVEGSDAWRHTSYGFVHDSEHALLAPFRSGSAVEVSFEAAFAEQFDQAGIFVRSDAEHWVKAGVEYADGVLQLGAVATNGHSDWSVAPVPEWAGQHLLIRVSWSGGALTVRAAVAGQAYRLVRVIPWLVDTASAGPFLCAPTRAGFSVTFRRWRIGEADSALH